MKPISHIVKNNRGFYFLCFSLPGNLSKVNNTPINESGITADVGGAPGNNFLTRTGKLSSISVSLTYRNFLFSKKEENMNNS